MTRLFTVTAALLVAAGCAGAEPNLLGGRQKCWSQSEPRLASLMKGWIELDTNPMVMHTPEGEDLTLTFPFMTVKSTPDGDVRLFDGTTSVAGNGELVTVFGGLGADASMAVCAIEEHHDR